MAKMSRLTKQHARVIDIVGTALAHVALGSAACAMPEAPRQWARVTKCQQRCGRKLSAKELDEGSRICSRCVSSRRRLFDASEEN